MESKSRVAILARRRGMRWIKNKAVVKIYMLDNSCKTILVSEARAVLSKSFSFPKSFTGLRCCPAPRCIQPSPVV